MQKQKFDEIVSHFNKKVSEMEIETKYKMELLGMVTALGYAHEKETHGKTHGTHSCDLINRLSEIRSQYNCFNESEEPYYRALSEVIKKLSEQADGDTISRQAAITTIQRAYADTEGGTDKCAVWKNVGLTNALHIMQDLPPAQPASYRQVTGKLDCASRQAEIDAWKADFKGYVDCLDLLRDDYNGIMEYIDEAPSAQPEIIRCRNCKFASGDSRICMKFGHSPIGELDFCAWAERRTDG